MLALIALRNLARNRRRTLLSVLIVSVGTVAILLTTGFIRYSFDGLRDAVIHGGLGHLEVTAAPDKATGIAAPDRSSSPPILNDWQDARATIESRPDVLAAGAVIEFSGVATNGERSTSFVGLAVEPDRERRMGMTTKLRRGTDLPTDDSVSREDRVLLGVGLARALSAEPGDTIAVMTVTSDGSLNAVDMLVDGVFTTGFQELDGHILKTRVGTAQRLIGTDRVTSLIVSLASDDATIRAQKDLGRAFATRSEPISVVTWETRAPFYGQVRGLYSGIFAFLGVIVAVLVALSTSNTMIMSVLERVREFGTLLAVGTSRTQLARLLILEALWLALFGGITGSAVGMALVTLINFLKVEMPPPPSAVDPMVLALAVTPSDFLWISVFMTTILLVAAFPPILRVFRLHIVDALGHV